MAGGCNADIEERKQCNDWGDAHPHLYELLRRDLVHKMQLARDVLGKVSPLVEFAKVQWRGSVRGSAHQVRSICLAAVVEGQIACCVRVPMWLSIRLAHMQLSGIVLTLVLG